MLNKDDKAKIKRAVRAHNTCIEAECIAHIKRELTINYPCVVAIVDGRIRRYNSWREAYLQCGSIDEVDQSFVRYFGHDGFEVDGCIVHRQAYLSGRDARYGVCTHFNEDLCQCRHTGNAKSITVHVSYFGQVFIEHVENG
jgi:hypothetical protein